MRSPAAAFALVLAFAVHTAHAQTRPAPQPHSPTPAAAPVTFADLLSPTAARPEVLDYAAPPDPRRRLYVYQPSAHSPTTAPPPSPRPAIILVHGGAWVGGTPDLFHPVARYFASRGLVAINISYRHAKAGEVPLTACIADTIAAVRFVRAHAASLNIDPARIVVLGESAGGHLAAATVMTDFTAIEPPLDFPGDPALSARPDALVLLNPVADLTEGNWIRYAVGGAALADRKSPLPSDPASLSLARAVSPVFNVPHNPPPTLILHGTADTVVPVSQAQRLTDALTTAGGTCTLHLIDAAPHAFTLPNYKSPEPLVVDQWRTIDAYLASLGYLQGEPTLVLSPTPAWTPRPPSTRPTSRP